MENSKLIVNCVHTEIQETLSTHFHNTYEIIFVREGQAVFRVGEDDYLIKKGSLMFISQFEEHAIVSLSGNYQRYFTMLAPVFFERIIGDPKLASVFRYRTKMFRHHFEMEARFEDLSRYFAGILKEFQSREDYSTELVSMYLKQILILTYRAKPEYFHIKNSQMDTEIFSIQQYIDEHFSQDISISRIAAEHFISVYHLSRQFKALTGYSPKQYLMYIRLSHAKSLLLNSDLNVGQITVKCGFNDVNNFIRSYRKEFGLTPLQYRSSAKGQNLHIT